MPARAITSQINPDPRDQQSDQYRILEKEDISLNIESHPITGLGFGQPFAFIVPLPTISGWPFWHYTPHNEILWVWMDMGIAGFMIFWWVMGSGLYRGGRLIQALSAAGDAKARALMAASVCLIVMQITVSYVDLGLTSDRAMLLLGVVFGLIGHLPGILRRSVNLDETPRSGKGTTRLEAATPEAQAGLLARVLITPAAPESTRRRATRPRLRTQPRWSQSESGPSWPRPARPGTVVNENTTTPGSNTRPARWNLDESAPTWPGETPSGTVVNGNKPTPKNDVSSSRWAEQLSRWAEPTDG